MAGKNLIDDELLEAIRQVVRAESNRLRNTRGHRATYFGSEPNWQIAKTTIAHDKGASQDVDFYAGTKGSESTTGVTVSAYNRFADLETGKWCIAIFIGGGWELIAGEC